LLADGDFGESVDMLNETVQIPVLALWIMAGLAALYVLIPLGCFLFIVVKTTWEECHRR